MYSLNDDDFRRIQVLSANTTLQVQLNGILTAPLKSKSDSPQGDGLSPSLCAIYLEAATRSLDSNCLVRPEG